MSNHRFKWIPGTLAAAVASALLAFPAVAGAQTDKINLEDEIRNARKQQILRQLGQVAPDLKAHRTAMRSASGVSAQSVESATFGGKIEYNEVHYYWFETSGEGTVQVEPAQSPEKVDYVIVPVSGEGNGYYSGDSLPAGQYLFVVLNLDATWGYYSFKVSGIPFASAPDATVPNLKVSKPAYRHIRLPVGSTSVDVQGSHDGSGTIIYHEQGETDMGAAFSGSVPLSAGYGGISIFAYESSGNGLLRDYTFVVPGTKRISGANRYEVSAKVSRELYPEGLPEDVDVPVIIARGDLYTDALSGAPLAGLERSPILLSDYRTQSLPAVIQDEIRRLKPRRAIILGGTGSVSVNVENQLRSLGVAEIERIDGANRFAVSAKISQHVLDDMGGEQSGVKVAVVASGMVFPDALSASAPAGKYGLPILQVTKDTVPKEIEAFVQNNPYIGSFLIVGGPGTVGTSVEEKLRAYAEERGGVVQRIGGANRYEVAVNVAKHTGLPLSPYVHVFAKGTDFPDALSGSPLAIKWGGPILLTPTSKVETPVMEYLNSTRDKDYYYILGGTGSISTDVENQLKNTLQ